MKITWTAVALAALAAGCAGNSRNFGSDLAFLRRQTPVIVLSDPNGQAQVAVCPALQGRVMTSTPSGLWGPSFGWINYDLIASRKTRPHINAYGGEDRLWLGPEGGQFSIFFAPGVPFDLEHWFTPAAIDTESFPVMLRTQDRVRFRKRMSLSNASGTKFDLEIVRDVRLLAESDAWKQLALPAVRGVRMVAYESENRLVNMGSAAWTKEKGLLSLWVLGMFNPSPGTVVIIPCKAGSDAELGPAVNDAYFGKVPADRLAVRERAIYFSGDGQCRSKIGVSPRRARPILGSYDPDHGTLTLVQFTLPEGAADYVNSMWELQKEPYAGDAVNSYNDGSPAPGVPPLGPFYELESSSPAAALKPGQDLTHIHRTFHFEGEEEELDSICRRALGVSLHSARQALKR